jgi:hypothetical protein
MRKLVICNLDPNIFRLIKSRPVKVWDTSQALTVRKARRGRGEDLEGRHRLEKKVWRRKNNIRLDIQVDSSDSG